MCTTQIIETLHSVSCPLLPLLPGPILPLSVSPSWKPQLQWPLQGGCLGCLQPTELSGTPAFGRILTCGRTLMDSWPRWLLVRIAFHKHIAVFTCTFTPSSDFEKKRRRGSHGFSCLLLATLLFPRFEEHGLVTAGGRSDACENTHYRKQKRPGGHGYSNAEPYYEKRKILNSASELPTSREDLPGWLGCHLLQAMLPSKPPKS